MRNKKLLISILVMSFLMVGAVSAITEEIISDSFVIEEIIPEIGEFHCFNSGVEVDCNFGIEEPIVLELNSGVVEPTFDVVPLCWQKCYSKHQDKHFDNNKCYDKCLAKQNKH